MPSSAESIRTVAIAGVGLIGGSFALALRRAGFSGRIIGVSSPVSIEKALELGVVDQGLPLQEALAEADLVYMAQPVLGILEILPRLAGKLREGRLVTDAGSTKAAICQRARQSLPRGSFLGGHPMAGKEKSGVEAAEADLFEGRVYVLTPDREEDLRRPIAQEFVTWIERIGSRVLILDAERHDCIVALTSHLAQVASTALAATLEEQLGSDPEARDLIGPGLLDMTRLALSPYGIWEGILKTNTAPLATAIEQMISQLTRMEHDLRGAAPREIFARANRFARQARFQGDSDDG